MKGDPCILITGQYFNRKSGAGITLSNLFEGWNKTKIAAATSAISDPSFEICENYYQLGSLEFELRFPFNLKHGSDQYYSGRITQRELSISEQTSITGSKSVFRKIYEGILFTSGLIHYRSKFRISDKFLEWIKELRPEIIYSQLSSLEEMRIVSMLQEKLKLPVAIHIMDDWPSTISERYFPKFIWRKIIHKHLIRIFSEAKVLLSISESMSEEYFKRYGLRFMPFHNPINIEKWLPHSKTKWEIEGKFKILYSGRIGRANGKAIIFMANIINEINLSEEKVTLDIYTPDSNNKYAISISSLSGVNVKKTVDYKEMPSLLASYDLLFLPLDFDGDGIRFAKLSMPTKTSEYMISGTPILIYSPEETAVAKFFSNNNCGYCVTHQSKDELKKAIQFLISNEGYRQEISCNAVKLAKGKFDDEKVRAEFRRVLLTATT